MEAGEESVPGPSLHSSNEDDEDLTWSAIRRLPTSNWLRTSLLKSLEANENQETKIVDVTKLDTNDMNQFLENNFKVVRGR
ncbi:Pleiotropic drug resistance protein 2 [Euphorbia peplus]|nr:Pleiotropic drug resistance protein 2 [Euphorbia peplus]